MAVGRAPLRRLAAASLLLAVAADARGQEMNATVEPTYSHRETEATDQAGRTTHTLEDRLAQRYYLTLDWRLTQFLSATAGANLLDEKGWIGTDGVWRDAGGRISSLFGRLSLGGPVLSGGLGATRQETRAYPFAESASVSESFYADAVWRPRELPELDVRVARLNAYDSLRRARDATTDSAAFGARYQAQEYDLRYILSWNRADDRLQKTQTTFVDQNVFGSRRDRFLGGRTSTYVSGTFQDGTASIEREGPGGTVTRLQLAFQGLSAVEAFPATAEDIELVPNPPLVDGGTTTSAGVNVGFGPTVSGDRDARHVGAGFADAVTPVNTIYVWLDRDLPPEVASALAASMAVYRSDDNRRWAPVPIVSPPAVSTFERRIEVTIAQTEARYLKATLLPLAAAITTDPAFRELFVTEVQFLLVLPAALVPTRQHTRSWSATGLARTLLLREPGLAHDGSLTVRRRDDAPVTWTLSNSLTLSHKLARWLEANARGARLDEDLGLGHEGSWQWSAGLIGTPVPTAQWTLLYSGRKRDDGELTNGVTALARADWYDGVSTQANATYSVLNREDETTHSFQAGGRAALTPNPWVNLSAGGQYQWSRITDERGWVMTQSAVVDGSLAIRPVPAASLSGTITRAIIAVRPTTLGTLSVNYFPLRGELQLSVGYSKTLDTAAETTTEILSPTLRWEVRPGVSLRSSYTYLRNDAPALLLVTRAVEASLLISL